MPSIQSQTTTRVTIYLALNTYTQILFKLSTGWLKNRALLMVSEYNERWIHDNS